MVGDEYISITELKKKLFTTDGVIRERAKNLGVESKLMIGEGYRRERFFKRSDIKRIAGFRNPKIYCDSLEVQETIINAFKNMPNNTTSNISIQTGIAFSTVDRILTKYYKNNGCIIVESKMNKG